MPISDERRPSLPARLTTAQRDFYLELRRLVVAAGLSCRALEEVTSARRSGVEESYFYSKTQWGRWLNGLAPPRRAIRKLSERLVKDAIPGGHLVDLWDAAFAPSGREDSVNTQRPAGQLRPRQLPISTQRFIGRTAELELLTALTGQVASSDGTVVVVLEGTAGVGKTTLACHFARGVAEQFPDAQLYVDLRGFDHAAEPVPAIEALSGFLDALGEPGGSYRTRVEDQAALYRSVLAGKRALIVIENARDAEQVRHLLPAGRGCLVLVTSRNRLSGLVAQGARPLRLDPFTSTEARELLSSRLGADRIEQELPAADELIGLCAGLPLALGVAAAHIAANPHFPISVLTGELRKRRLDVLETGDPATTTRTVLARSCQYLNAAAATMFRLLGVHPGPDISVAAAASLAGASMTEARRALDELTRAHLVNEHQPGRYAFHALLRAYAAE